MESKEKNAESTGSVSCEQAPPTQVAPSVWLRIWRWLRPRSKDSAFPARDGAKDSTGTDFKLLQWENLQTLLIAVILAILIRAYVAESRYIPSGSMLPTLQIGDRVIVEKLSSYFHPPRPGDIVVFYPPKVLQAVGFTADQVFIKRVIGNPGQVVRVDHGTVYLNGQPVTEPYIAEPPNYEWGPWQVPDHTFFVMGDNRNNSNDSHIWGFLPEDHVIGRAWFRFWPLGRIGPI